MPWLSFARKKSLKILRNKNKINRFLESNNVGRKAHGSVKSKRAQQPPVGRAVTEGDAAASTAFGLLPAPGAPAVGAEGRLRTAQEPSRGPAAHASELRRDGGGARVEGCDGVGDGGEGRGGSIFYRRGEGGLAERGLEAVDDSGGDLHRRGGAGRSVLGWNSDLSRSPGCVGQLGLALPPRLSSRGDVTS